MSREKFLPQPVWNKPGEPSGAGDGGAEDSDLAEIPMAPEGWIPLHAATRQLCVVANHIIDDQTFKPYLMRSVSSLGMTGHYIKRARPRGPGPVTSYFSSEIVERAITEFMRVPFAPDLWKTLNGATEELRNVLQLNISRDVFKPYLVSAVANLGETNHYIKKAHPSGKPYFSPLAVAHAISEFLKIPIAQQGWQTLNGAAIEYKQATGRKIFVETFKEYLDDAVRKLGSDHYHDKARSPQSGTVAPHYSPQAITEATNNYVVNRPSAPALWKSATGALNQLRETTKIKGPSHKTFKPFLDEAVKRLGEEEHYLRGAVGGTGGPPSPRYSPECIDLAIALFSEIPMAPIGWKVLESATKQATVAVSQTFSKETFKPYLDKAIKALGSGHYLEKARSLRSSRQYSFYSPEAVTEAITAYQNQLSSQRGMAIVTAELVSKYLDPKTPEGRAYQEVVFALGPEAARDLLYAMRPELKTVPVEDLDGHLAPYLGEYRPPQPFPLGPIIDRVVPLLEHVPLQALLLASIKREGQRAYFQARKASDPPDPSTIQNYFRDLRSYITQSSPAIESVLKQAEDYFLDEIMGPISLHDRVLPNLTAGRPFPDMYQRINMSEIRSHQHFLIADEMGVGKSASAILAKESMGMKCALIVAPAAVCSTWEGYVSDRVRDDGKQVGYFKPGSAPRSLVIGSPKDLQRLRTETFEYVVVSREKLTNNYMSALKALNFDMLVVDEVHEHKRGERGVYSKNLLELASRIDSPEKRLVLLSGTPVPNKVQDVAMLIKLLHPEMQDEPIGSLSRSILTSDLLASRANLLPLMQMKSLSDHVEMPELRIEKVDVALSPQEEEQYTFLLETDDLEPQVKMPLLRKFLLNPASVVDVPTIESAKIRALKAEIAEALKTKRKIMVFVNDFVENILRGDGSILDQLGLPPEISTYIIHGNDKKEGRRREQTREQFRTDNRPSILFLSGQTDSLGVDYSHADHAIFYNEPWTYAEFQQQVARIHRPQDLLKRTPLTCRVLVAKGTIEEGIYEYIRFKHEAVQKLMRGVPLTREQHDALQLDIEGAGPDDIEVNPELPLYYRSRFAQIMKMFGHTKERGQAQFMAALRDDGADYAAIYEMFGGRSYQDNAARVCGNLIRSMASEQGRTAPDILDVGSGPAMLFRRSPGDVEGRKNHIVSLDLIRAHFEEKKLGMTVVGGMADIPFPEEKHFDYVNMSFSIQDTAFDPENGEYERIHAFAEASRMLRMNGRLLVNMIYTADFRDEQALASALEKFGFRAVQQYGGEVTSGATYKSRVLVFEKVADIQEQTEAIIATFSSGELNGFRFLSKTNQEKRTRARGRLSQRDRIISNFELNGKSYTVELNSGDGEIRAEEQKIIDEVEAMKDAAEDRKIVNIPKGILMQRGYSRLKSGKLFKIVPGDGQITLT